MSAGCPGPEEPIRGLVAVAVPVESAATGMPEEICDATRTPSCTRAPGRAQPSSLSPRGVLLMAAWFGLVTGYLDLGGVILKKDVLHASVYYKQGWFFPWTVPLSDLTVLMVPGCPGGGFEQAPPGAVSRHATAGWMLATLGLWGALLNLPLSGAASLLPGGRAGPMDWPGGRGTRAARRRWGRRSLVGLAGSLAIVAAASIGRHALAESRALARLPAPPPGAPNVLLIVLDTVRARQPEPLRISARDHAPTDAVGAAGRPVRPGRGAGRVDVPVALQPLHRTMALRAECSLASRPRHPRSHACRVPRRAGVSDRRVRRPTPAIAARRPAWAAASPTTRITRSRP